MEVVGGSASTRCSVAAASAEPRRSVSQRASDQVALERLPAPVQSVASGGEERDPRVATRRRGRARVGISEQDHEAELASAPRGQEADESVRREQRARLRAHGAASAPPRPEDGRFSPSSRVGSTSRRRTPDYRGPKRRRRSTVAISRGVCRVTELSLEWFAATKPANGVSGNDPATTRRCGAGRLQRETHPAELPRRRETGELGGEVAAGSAAAPSRPRPAARSRAARSRARRRGVAARGSVMPDFAASVASSSAPADRGSPRTGKRCLRREVRREQPAATDRARTRTRCAVEARVERARRDAAHRQRAAVGRRPQLSRRAATSGRCCQRSSEAIGN